MSPTDTALRDLVAVAGGTVMMGDNEGRPDERPAHRVHLDAFLAARRPVTNAEYAVFLESTGRSPTPFEGDARFAEPNKPVVGVSWFDAMEFCAWLSSHSKL